MLSVREAAHQLETPPRTLYRWLVEHKAFLRIERQGKRMIIHPDSMELLRRIAQHYTRGDTTAQINEDLQQQSLPLIVTAEASESQPSSGLEVLQQLLCELKTLGNLRELAEQSQLENATLKSMLAHQADELSALRHEMADLRELLTPTPVEPTVPLGSPRRHKGFWSWLRGSSTGSNEAQSG